ncbi:MAG: DUF2497 domain-containing protein [Alphaproteobacteria bacterium]|nr:DUF2497 domain-containing protein [Alphaproteobacteria bacterium]
MNFQDSNPNDEMSMEDILSSIRKYVSEEGDKKETEPVNNDVEVPQENVIKLDETHVSRETDPEITPATSEPSKIYEEQSTLSENVVSVKPKRPSPFEQLTNALNSYGRKKSEQKESGAITVEQLFSGIAERVVREWLDKNMERLVEKIVQREIEKMKAE